MANEKDDKPAKTEPKAQAPVADGLIEVKKDGEKLRVHPSCVKDHVAVGWKQ